MSINGPKRCAELAREGSCLQVTEIVVLSVFHFSRLDWETLNVKRLHGSAVRGILNNYQHRQRKPDESCPRPRGPLFSWMNSPGVASGMEYNASYPHRRMNQTRSSNQSQGKAKGKKSSKGASRAPKQQSERTTTKSKGAAQASRPGAIGMKDLIAHEVSWLAGYTTVGNGTLGTTDAVYFEPGASTGNVVNNATGSGMVPILGADTAIGQSYVSDIEKHYSRKRIRKVTLELVSLNPSTANACMVYVGPVRGPGAAGDTSLSNGVVTAATLPNVLGMTDALTAASYESKKLEMTRFIAGGSGGAQNEFAISRDGDDVSTAWGAGNMDLDMIAPCAFVVAGTNATAALRGTRVHMIVIRQIVDLLDFLGGQSLAIPEAFVTEAKMELVSRLGQYPALRELYEKCHGKPIVNKRLTCL